MEKNFLILPVYLKKQQFFQHMRPGLMTEIFEGRKFENLQFQVYNESIENAYHFTTDSLKEAIELSFEKKLPVRVFDSNGRMLISELFISHFLVLKEYLK